MKNIKVLLFPLLLLFTALLLAQTNPDTKKIKISGIIIEKNSKQPLEYATITLTNVTNPKDISGGITNPKGEFVILITPGTYTIKSEFISFKANEIKNVALNKNTNLGTIGLDEDATQLNQIEIRAEKSTIEIKLDKKVYNVGQDLMVKGGTVSDVLDNIPSVSVDIEGNVSVRGNENVKILIDGRPSNAISIAEALRLIPADAIDKVEVITNPSARYDAAGGGGLLNIILKKGKNQGFNGVVLASSGYPNSNGLSGTLNYKTKNFNIFTTQGYNYRNSPGNTFVATDYLNNDINSPNHINETRKNNKTNTSYNANLGIEWYVNKTITWTNTFNLRKSKGTNLDNVNFENNYSNPAKNFLRNRISNEDSESTDAEFVTSLLKKFKKEGHKLGFDAQYSQNNDLDVATIKDSKNGIDFSSNDQRQTRGLLQTDYVLPFGKGSQFEAGYRGDYTDRINTVLVNTNEIPNPNFTNKLQYQEKINALYTQYGTKSNKLSFLFGLRWEDSNIAVNQLTSEIYKNKKYNNFFPSAFITYEISDASSLSSSYSKRINRPGGRQLNPFSNYSSNINIFQGNPDINPAMTDAIDLSFLKKWSKITLSTSLYINKTTDVFQYVRKESGTFATTIVAGSPDIKIPIIITSPINLGKEYRGGFEFTLNYAPYKWWKLNSNFNFFKVNTIGNYTYVDFNGVSVTQNFDSNATSWSTKLSSKITLPYKIDMQINGTYNGPQINAQGKSLGVYGANFALSKDVFKDKGTFSFNINDVFNSRKRMIETFIPGLISSYSEMQWRERQFTLSFTYRFNKQKSDRDKQQKKPQESSGDDFPG